MTPTTAVRIPPRALILGALAATLVAVSLATAGQAKAAYMTKLDGTTPKVTGDGASDTLVLRLQTASRAIGISVTGPPGGDVHADNVTVTGSPGVDRIGIGSTAGDILVSALTAQVQVSGSDALDSGRRGGQRRRADE